MPPNWFWWSAFLCSIFGIFIFGLKPQYLYKYWWILLTYNLIIILLASYYIVMIIRVVYKQKEQKVVGSNFTITLIKIIPILTIIPVLSFYLFSFQTVQDNLQLTKQGIARFNADVLIETDVISEQLYLFRNSIYTNNNSYILNIVWSFMQNIKKNSTYNEDLKLVLNKLTASTSACKLMLWQDDKIISSSDDNNIECDVWENYKVSNKIFSVEEHVDKNTLFTQLPLKSIISSSSNLILFAYYFKNKDLGVIMNTVKLFQQKIKKAKILLSYTILAKQFLIDFSSTIVLTLVSLLIISLKMIEKIMVPLNNLSIASKKISTGEYGVVVGKSTKSNDINHLIEQFNSMSKQIQISRSGLDTKNLYLETIIKYSSGIIALDNKFRISLINDKVKNILDCDNHNVIGKFYTSICQDKKHMKKLFLAIEKQFNINKSWLINIELIIKQQNILLNCQGATLKNNNVVLGYIVIINDISAIKRNEKLSAWNEVAMRVAHEIKNPLNPILIGAQRLKNNFLTHDKLTEKEKNIINKITSTITTQVHSINTMVNAFMSHDDSLPRFTTQSLNKIIKKAVLLYEGSANITLDLGKIANIKLDKYSISRVIINLIKNSIEASIDKKKAQITIATKQLEKFIILTITDKGMGFDDNIIDKAFESYVTNKSNGSGLGMVIVKKIITAHSGKISIDKNYKSGAKIIIKFKV